LERSHVEQLLNEVCASEPAAQVYLYSKAGRVTGLAEGFHHYAPERHRLESLSPQQCAGLAPNSGRGVNESIYAGSAFTLFITAPTESIGKTARHAISETNRRQALLTAGRLGQALMSAAPELEIGLCPIGSLAFKTTPTAQELLYSFEGGAISPTQREHWAVEEPPGKPDPHSELREYLAAHLPAYMVPSTYVVLDKLPLTANGKVDRKALPQPEDIEQPQQAYAPPRTPLEHQLCAIWQQILDLPQVGIHDNFFEIGGNSLLAIQAINLIREQFDYRGTDLSLPYLFRNPSPAKWAEPLALYRDIQTLEQSKQALSRVRDEDLELGEV
jgi:hypothetical protein